MILLEDSLHLEITIYIVKFLLQHALKDPEKKWWWLYQASYIANYSLKNKDMAIRMAYLLQKLAPDIEIPDLSTYNTEKSEKSRERMKYSPKKTNSSSKSSKLEDVQQQPIFIDLKTSSANEKKETSKGPLLNSNDLVY